MNESPALVYWDSMVIIHRIQRTPEHIPILEQITDAAERGEIKIVVSTYSIAEVVKDPDGGVLSEEEDQKIIDLFENDYFIVRDITIPISHLSRQISRKFGVKPKDAVHLATAILWKVPVFHTYEDRLLSKDGKIGDPPLKIAKPYYTGQQSLIFEAKAEAKEEKSEAKNIEQSTNTPTRIETGIKDSELQEPASTETTNEVVAGKEEDAATPQEDPQS